MDISKYGILAALLLTVAALSSCMPAGGFGETPNLPTIVRTQDTSPTPASGGVVPMSDPAERAMGRFVEAPVALTGLENVRFGEITFADGRLYAITGVGNKVYSTADVVTWESAATGEDFSAVPGFDTIRGFAVLHGGDAYILYQKTVENDGEYEVRTGVARSSGGAVTHLSVEEVYPDYLAALPSGDFVLGSGSHGAHRFGADGGMMVSYTSSGVTALAAGLDEVAAYIYQEKRVAVYDAASGELKRELPVDFSGDGERLAYGKDGSLYLASGEGIYRVTPGGTLWERIVDGSLCRSGTPGFSARNFFLAWEDEPMLYGWDASEAVWQLYRYRYDPAIPTEPETVLNVYSLYESSYLRQCAALFQARFPDAMVRFTVALSDETAVTRDDAIRTLNMEVLGGQGPDILLLDGLPVQSYVEKGVLADLTDVISPLMGDGTLLGNIAGAFRVGEALPAVPLRFSFPVIWGDAEGLDTLEELAAWTREHADTPPFANISPRNLLERFYYSCAPAWYDGGGLIDAAALEDFLSGMMALYDPWRDMPGTDKLSQARQRGIDIPHIEWNPYARQSEEDMYGAAGLAYGDNGFTSLLLGGADAMMVPFGAVAQAGRGGIYPLPGQAEGAFFPMGILGVNAGSANPDVAKDFVRLALDAEPQSLGAQDGLPVNLAALTAQMNQETSDFSSMMNLDDGRSLIFQWPDRATRDRVVELAKELTTPVLPDTTLFAMMEEETAAFFAGEEDAAAAARRVADRANAYLAE